MGVTGLRRTAIAINFNHFYYPSLRGSGSGASGARALPFPVHLHVRLKHILVAKPAFAQIALKPSLFGVGKLVQAQIVRRFE